MSQLPPTPTMPPPPQPGGPTPIAASDLLASRWRRFFAITIDSLILIVPMFTAMVVCAMIVVRDDMTAREEDNALTVIMLVVLLVACALYLFAYLPLTMSRQGERNGQTLGKQALGVRVVTAEGVPVTYGRVMRRELLGTWLINMVTGLYSIADYGFGLFDGRRQCLHDKIASTYVLQEQIPFGDGRPPLPLTQRPVASARTYPAQQQHGAQQQPYGAPAPQPQPFASPPPAADRPRHSWQPPRQDDGNEAARRAFGDDS